MASYLPPTEELPIFDNQVFNIANNSYLTFTEAKKYFVSFPIAQGTATISDLIAGTISYLSPASGSFFEIGTNQVSGGTIRIGPTGETSGVSVHCANLDFNSSNINNATSSTTGLIKLTNSQTTGALYIGGGSTTAARTSGPIIIGSDLTASGGINIGTGTNLTVPTVNTINIGSGTYGTNVLGTLTSTGLITGNNALTISSGNITATIGTIIAPTIRNGANTGSISSGGTLTGTSLVLGSGAIGCGSITATGLITADGGLTLNSGDLLTATGGIKTTTIDVPAPGNSLDIGNTQTGGTIVIGSGKTSGYIQLGGANTNNSVIIKPYLDLENDIRMGNGVGIRLSLTSYSPSIYQLGYNTSSSNPTPQTGITTTGTNIITITNLQIGIYIVTFQATMNTYSLTTGMYLQTSFPVTGGCTNSFGNHQFAGSANSSCINVTGTLICTTATNTCAFRIVTSSGTVTCNNVNYSVVKIA